jgi:histidinol-phosphate phosphatase family protein
MSDLQRAVFIDKDGTLVENVPYNVDPALVRLTRGAGYGLELLARYGYRLFVVSNQSGIAHGYFPASALQAVEARIAELLAPANAALDGWYYCPHAPDAKVAQYALHCTCRKPRAGLLRRAAAEQRIDLTRSWLIGDILDDVQAGRRAGCKTVLIVNGNETQWRLKPERMPHRFATDLAQAARMIVAREPVAPNTEPSPAHAHGLD